MRRNCEWLLAIFALLLAAALKAWLILSEAMPFNADEAIVALMARHIRQGARPIFFYGQAYMGSLDAFLVAGAFSLWGEKVWVIRLVQSALYLGVLLVVMRLGKHLFGASQVGVLAAFLLAIPSVNVSLYTTVSLGGYGEALLIGHLILLFSVQAGERWKAAFVEKTTKMRRNNLAWREVAMAGWIGFLMGVGLWAFGLSLVYSLPAALYLLIRMRHAPFPWRQKGLWGGSLVVGAVAGAAPWWIYALQHGWQDLIGELLGSAIAGVEVQQTLARVGTRLFGVLVLGTTVTLGLRPPWAATWLALPLAPVALAFWIWVAGFIWGTLRRNHPLRLEQGALLGVGGCVLLGLLLTPFGADPSGRYFLPLASLLALFGAAMVWQVRQRWGQVAYALILIPMLYHLVGTLQCARRMPPGITTQFYAPSQIDHRTMGRLIEFLEREGERWGYTNYWVAYPLAFLSEERLIFVPRLPYHLDFRYTPRDNRYLLYDHLVSATPQVAYITTHHPELDARLRAAFVTLGVAWQEAWIGDYHLFYRLSRPVRPEELGFGTGSLP